jgi:hypothetical protein
MKKQLPTDMISNELSESSVFFPKAAVTEQAQTEEPEQTTSPASTGERKIAEELASYQASLIATIRKTVRQLGKEVSFVRLTPEEKQQLADIVYTYKRQGVRTSENEINRIAINFLLEDYLAHGQASILAKVLEALYA